jgi:nucleotide-binding universal stress UspA family protein
MKIVIGTDGSEAATHAARTAARLFGPDADIVLVEVVPEYHDPMEDAGGIEGPLTTPEQAEADWKEHLAEAGGDLAATARATDPVVTTLIVPSDQATGEALASVALEQGADVLVIGDETQSFFGRWFGHHVAQRAIKAARCPVLVIPSPD